MPFGRAQTVGRAKSQRSQISELSSGVRTNSVLPSPYMKSKRKGKTLQVRLSDQEYRQILEAAEKQQFTVSQLSRMRLLRKNKLAASAEKGSGIDSAVAE